MFIRWFTETSYGIQITDATVVTGTMTVYAHQNKSSEPCVVNIIDYALLEDSELKVELYGFTADIQEIYIEESAKVFSENDLAADDIAVENDGVYF